RRAPRRARVPELLVSLQPAAGSGRVLPCRPRSPPAPRHAREVLPGRRPRRGRLDRAGARAVREGVPGGRPARGVPARPDLAGLSPSLSASLDRRALQAPAALPALDGPPRIARLRPLDLDLAGAAPDAHRHARREHQPVDRPHPPPFTQLEDGRGDHRAARPDRRRGSGEVRLRALPQTDVGRLSRSPRRARLRAVRLQAGLPALERAPWLSRRWWRSAAVWAP